jgi:glucokinase
MSFLSAAPVSASVQRITPAALLEQAVAAFNDGRLIEALHYARTLRTHALQSAEAVYVEVLSLLAAGKRSRAARLLQQYEVILSANAGSLALGRHAWGRYHLLQGNAERALPLLQEAAIAMPDNQACLLDVAEAAAT